MRINWDNYKIDDTTYVHSPIEVNSLLLGFKLITKKQGYKIKLKGHFIAVLIKEDIILQDTTPKTLHCRILLQN